MSVIDASRKVLQDFIATELRAIAARLDSLEKQFADADKRAEKRYDSLEKQMAELERRSEKRHDETMAAIRQVIDFNSIQQRLAKLKSREAAHQ